MSVSVDAAAYPRRPWLTIWTRPRATIRAIIDSDPYRHVLLLAALSGLSAACLQVTLGGAIFFMPLLGYLLVHVGIACVGGITGIFLLGWMVEWVGSQLRGEALPEEIRAALAWACVPNIALGPVWLTEILIFGGDSLGSDFFFPVPDDLYWINVAIGQVVSIGGLLIAVRCTAEVQGFSAWRAAANLLLAVVVFIPLVIVLGVVVGVVIHLLGYIFDVG